MSQTAGFLRLACQREYSLMLVPNTVSAANVPVKAVSIGSMKKHLLPKEVLHLEAATH